MTVLKDDGVGIFEAMNKVGIIDNSVVMNGTWMLDAACFIT
jgi:hypothetical protein